MASCVFASTTTLEVTELLIIDKLEVGGKTPLGTEEVVSGRSVAPSNIRFE